MGTVVIDYYKASIAVIRPFREDRFSSTFLPDHT